MESAQGERDFHIVGVGASTGAVDALSSLLANVRPESLALVVVPHRAVHGEDSLAEAISQRSGMEIVPLSDTTKVLPNRVYVAPLGCDVGLVGGTLHLMQPALPLTRQPIDFFFRSLAEDQGDRAVGVVLSGTGLDGTFGLKAIKAAGGVTFAQNAASTHGHADVALPPDGIAQELMRLAKHQYFAKPKTVPRYAPAATEQILRMFRTTFGSDFSMYKPTTLERRIERRLALNKLARIEDYVRYLEGDADELHRLYKDMLVGVTAFFRDGEPFDALKRTAFPRLFERKEPGSKVRVWVPGCSTGEEAYSVAIALFEFLGDRADDYTLQIFGTDIDDDAITRARRGVYAENIRIDVNDERLHRFFVKSNGAFQIARRVRNALVFSKHDLVRDAPFSHIDLVCCRNVLIYLETAAQKRVLEALSYGLEPNGFLMLGTSETVGDVPGFASVDGRNKLYANRRLGEALPEAPAEPWTPTASLPSLTDPRAASAKVAERAERAMLDYCAPPAIVVTDTLDVLHFHGRTAPFLQPAKGFASLNLLRLARAELHADLRRIVVSALKTGTPAFVTTTLDDKTVRLDAVPVDTELEYGRCVLVLFHALPPELRVDGTSAETRTRGLERELRASTEYLQRVIEELQSANEELKSNNEELVALNEALHCTNEEMETSREALQSANEELTSVNAELAAHAEERDLTTHDLRNVLLARGEALIVLDANGNIERFAGAAERMFELGPRDIGRSVGALDRHFTRLRLKDLVTEATEGFARFDVQDETLRVRVVPYVARDNTIGGVTLLVSPSSQSEE